jgi:2-polyprenyl-3-methyl-5-hydroxy-6-metoxy-1,4-benzoquinol methylase
MPDAHYELPELAALYDINSGWSKDRDFYRRLPGPTPKAVLEVGCGTGLISRALAEDGHDVTAVDPAQAMLDVGKTSPHGDNVHWVQGYAQDFHFERHFDVVFMTGHAFQVLLTDEDIHAALVNIWRHLKPGGIFAFETRNPALPWERIFDTRDTLPTPQGPIAVEWRVDARRGELIRFHTHYHLPDGERVSDSTLRFLPLDRLSEMVTGAGLTIEAVHGDWEAAPFIPQQSREIILVTRRMD